MGMFSFIEKGLGLRTGATRAAKDAKAAGEVSLAEQQALQDQIGGIYSPYMDAGRDAFEMLSAYFGGPTSYGGGYTTEQQANIDRLAELKTAFETNPENIKELVGKNDISKEINRLEGIVSGYTPEEARTYNPDQIINMAKTSPFYEGVVKAGEEGVLRNQAATGGFRSGTTQENLAQVNQMALQDAVSQQLSGLSNIANVGMGTTDAYTTAMQNLIAGQGATRGQIANIDIQSAARKGSILPNVLGLGVQGLGSYIGAGGSFGG